jgi:hypothetical protein
VLQYRFNIFPVENNKVSIPAIKSGIIRSKMPQEAHPKDTKECENNREHPEPFMIIPVNGYKKQAQKE